MPKVGTAYVSIRAKLDKLERDLRDSRRLTEKHATAMQKSVSNIFKTIAAGASLAALGYASKKIIDLSENQEKAERKLQAVIKSTGGAAGLTADQMKQYAQSLQRATTVGDELIINAEAILATFTNIRGEAFERTIESALDLSTILDQDLKSSILQLGKALNDPVANLGALGRAGIQFSKDQKEQIKTLWESGEQLKAQEIILKELERQFGGTARAMRDTFEGAAAGASNAFTDLLEKLGDGITKNDELIKGMNELEKVFTDPEFIQSIVEIGKAIGVMAEALASAAKYSADILATFLTDTWQKGVDLFKSGAITGSQFKQFADSSYLQRRKLLEEWNKTIGYQANEWAGTEDIWSPTKKTPPPAAGGGRPKFSGFDTSWRDAQRMEALLKQINSRQVELARRSSWEVQQVDPWLNPDLQNERLEAQARGLQQLYDEEHKFSTMMADLSQHTAEAMQDAFSDFFFDAFTGRLEDLGDFIEGFMNTLLRSISQYLSQILFDSLGGGGSIFDLFSGIGGLFSGGSSYGPLASSGTAYAPTHVGAGGTTAFGFAEGGTLFEPVAGIGLRSGSRYTFAENGPETITPGAGGGDTFYVQPQFNVSAIDAQSTELFLRRNMRSITETVIDGIETSRAHRNALRILT